jgi:hypothetical protein
MKSWDLTPGQSEHAALVVDPTGAPRTPE